MNYRGLIEEEARKRLEKYGYNELVGIVKATGENTYFGKTAKLVEEAKEESKFQKVVLRIGNYLIILATAIIFIVVLVSISRHEIFWRY